MARGSVRTVTAGASGRGAVGGWATGGGGPMGRAYAHRPPAAMPPRRSRRTRRPRPAPAPAAPPPAPPAGHWRLTGIERAEAVLARLDGALAGGTDVVTVGDRRSWFALAGARSSAAPGFGPAAAAGEQRLPCSRATLHRLALAARTDAPVPFCRELRVLAGDATLLLWTEPGVGALRLDGRVPAPVAWTLAALSGATRQWVPGGLR